MPENPLTDPITDQEIAFAHLILSGAMNDHRAAESVGLHPSTAAYTKSRPRVRAYMREHRADVSEKLINQEAFGMRTLSLGRDQILSRLWQLANLSPEATRGSIAGQVKAMAMIIAIESLIPDRISGRRLRPIPTQPTAPPVHAKIDGSEAMRQKRQGEGTERAQAVSAVEAQPAGVQVPEPPPGEDAPFLNRHRYQTSFNNPFVKPQAMNRIPEEMRLAYDVDLNAAGSLRLPFPRKDAFVARNR